MIKFLFLLANLCWLSVTSAAPFDIASESNFTPFNTSGQQTKEQPWQTTTVLLNACRDCALLRWTLASAPQTLSVDVPVSPKSYFINGSSLGHFHILIQLNEWNPSSDQGLGLALQPFINGEAMRPSTLTLASATP